MERTLTPKNMRSLRYIVTTLAQITVMLREFELDDAAQLLDKAKIDLASKLPLASEDGVDWT